MDGRRHRDGGGARGPRRLAFPAMDLHASRDVHAPAPAGRAPLARLAWAAPASAIGAAAALLVLVLGGRGRRVAGVLEVALPRRLAESRAGRRLPFAAITLGHVVLGVSLEALDRWRRHERVHVRQFERWGAALLVAYPLESVWQWLRGGRAYLDNRFEVAARAGERGGG